MRLGKLTTQTLGLRRLDLWVCHPLLMLLLRLLLLRVELRVRRVSCRVHARVLRYALRHGLMREALAGHCRVLLQLHGMHQRGWRRLLREGQVARVVHTTRLRLGLEVLKPIRTAIYTSMIRDDSIKYLACGLVIDGLLRTAAHGRSICRGSKGLAILLAGGEGSWWRRGLRGLRSRLIRGIQTCLSTSRKMKQVEINFWREPPRT